VSRTIFSFQSNEGDDGDLCEFSGGGSASNKEGLD
jgi:hypothetical protein